MKISIVIISYNHEKYIKKAIDSVLMQNRNFDIEILIGDDNSTDNTPLIIEEYIEKYSNIIIPLLRKENLGPTKNLYDLYSRCTGDYIATLEGDDYWTDPYKLQKQVDYLVNSKDYIATMHPVEVIDKNNKIIKTLPDIQYDSIDNCEQYLNLLINKKSIWHLQTLVFKNIFINNDKYRDIMTCSRYIGDIPLNLVILQEGKIKFLNENMGVYRFITNSSSFSSLNTLKRVDDTIIIWRVFNQITNNKYKSKINYIIDDLKIFYFVECIANKQYKKTLLYYVKEISIFGKVRCLYKVFIIIYKKFKRYLKQKKGKSK